MGEFIVAHKIAILLIGVALGGFILLTRRSSSSSASDGIPVNPYASNAQHAPGSFSFSDLLPGGPAGPVLDPVPGPPPAGEAPAAVDNSPVVSAFDPTAAQPSPTPTYQSTPEAVAAAGDLPYSGPLSNGQPGYVIDPSTGQVYTPSTAIEGGIRQRVGQPVLPDAVDRYLVNTAGYNPYTGTFAGPSSSPLSTGPGPAPAVSLPTSPPPASEPIPDRRIPRGVALAV